jgi:hypothetical protein
MSKGASRFSRKHFAIYALALVAAIALYVLLRAYTYPELSIYVRHSPGAFEGYTLLAPTVDDIGAPLEEANPIYLIGMDGEVVHSWSVLGSLQLAKLNPDGNLFYTTRDRSFRERAGLRKIDPFGNVLWYFKDRADHDFSVLPNDCVLLHCIEDSEAPAVAPGKVRSPRLREIDKAGQVLWEWRGEDHLAELTELAGIDFPKDISDGKHIYDGAYDWAHNNASTVIQENASGASDLRFRAGNILISYCNLNTIAVIDRMTGQIVWAWGPGTLDGQHNPVMLDNGDILLFDNGTKRGYSRVVELDPTSEEIVWEYSDHGDNPPTFFSPYTSGVDPLPNGNVLVCQASHRAPNLSVRVYAAVARRLLRRQIAFSRVFEVTRAKNVVWELVISHSGPLNYGLYQAARYTEGYARPLLAVVKSDEATRRQQLKSLPYMR